MRDFISHYKCIKQESLPHLPPLPARHCVKLSTFALCDWSATSASSQLGINEVGIQKALLKWAQESHPAGAFVYNSITFFFFLINHLTESFNHCAHTLSCLEILSNMPWETTISHLFEMEKWREENQRGFSRSVRVCSRFLPAGWISFFFFFGWHFERPLDVT